MHKGLLASQVVCCDQTIARALASSLQFIEHLQCVQNIIIVVPFVKIRKGKIGETETVVWKLRHSGIIWRALETPEASA